MYVRRLTNVVGAQKHEGHNYVLTWTASYLSVVQTTREDVNTYLQLPNLKVCWLVTALFRNNEFCCTNRLKYNIMSLFIFDLNEFSSQASVILARVKQRWFSLTVTVHSSKLFICVFWTTKTSYLGTAARSCSCMGRGWFIIYFYFSTNSVVGKIPCVC